jgi:hypothetical protein
LLAASADLGIDQEFAATLNASMKRLPAYQIGRWGQLQEWSVDFEENQPGQRHMSHLYPVYPGWAITSKTDPVLWKAARKSLERRLANGGAYTGWSRAWAIGLWARLLDGNMAWDSLKLLIEHSTGANLFDTHPARNGSIFQIDGNFGDHGGHGGVVIAEPRQRNSLVAGTAECVGHWVGRRFARAWRPGGGCCLEPGQAGIGAGAGATNKDTSVSPSQWP